MKVEVPTTKVVDVTHVLLDLAVRYEEDDIPNDFPLRDGDMWRAKVEIETGKIDGWPLGNEGLVRMKVRDEGTYRLLDAEGQEVAAIESNYVPHGLVPGEYGDYVDLRIDINGVITNWPTEPDLAAFFNNED